MMKIMFLQVVELSVGIVSNVMRAKPDIFTNRTLTSRSVGHCVVLVTALEVLKFGTTQVREALLEKRKTYLGHYL